jgi:hypothetical protein
MITEQHLHVSPHGSNTIVACCTVHKKKSVCKKYIAVYQRHLSDAIVICLETGNEYKSNYQEVNGKYFATKHMMCGFSDYAEGRPNGYCTLRFADCVEDMEIKPYTGNTIIKEYSAIFKK